MINISQNAASRKAVQSNANAYFAGSQEFSDDNEAAMNALIQQQCNDKANLISQWCSCSDYKDMMSQESELKVDVGFVDGNLLAQWETDLSNQGFLISYSGTGNAMGVSTQMVRYPIDKTLIITLPP
jgi:hypothetical protein